jgi:hypothetical protein
MSRLAVIYLHELVFPKVGGRGVIGRLHLIKCRMLSRLQLWLGLQSGREGLFRSTITHCAAIAGLRRRRSRPGGRRSGGSGASWICDRKQSRIPPSPLWYGLLQACMLGSMLLCMLHAVHDAGHSRPAENRGDHTPSGFLDLVPHGWCCIMCPVTSNGMEENGRH